MNHLKTNKQTTWSGEPNEAAIQLLQQEGKVIVCPTKVGYIIAVSDKKGLERKFSAKIANVISQELYYAAHWNNYKN